MTGRFLRSPVISSISFHRKVPTTTFERTVDQTKPRGPWRFEGRVAVLPDAIRRWVPRPIGFVAGPPSHRACNPCIRSLAEPTSNADDECGVPVMLSEAEVNSLGRDGRCTALGAAPVEGIGDRFLFFAQPTGTAETASP